ncbi:MAG TPA: hypothetical protein VIC52_09315, partial [Actinomycetota bacterium]
MPRLLPCRLAARGRLRPARRVALTTAGPTAAVGVAEPPAPALGATVATVATVAAVAIASAAVTAVSP